MEREIAPQPEERKEQEIASVPEISIAQGSSHLFWDQVEDEALDEESRRWIAATLDHPEWVDGVIAQLQKYKHVFAEDVQRYRKSLEDFRAQHAAPSSTSGWSESTAEDFRNRVRSLHTELGIRPEETVAHVTVLAPGAEKASGWGMRLGDTAVISSHPDNLENAEHEYLHTVINNCVEALPLDDGMAQEIVRSASPALREQYGDDVSSLLAETIIRTHLYGRDQGKYASELTNRVADLLQEYYDQGRAQGSFGTYLVQHVEQLASGE